MKNWVIKPLVEWLTDLIITMLNTLVTQMTAVGEATRYWEDGWALSARSIVATAAWTFLVTRVAYEAWRLYIAQSEGEQGAAPSVLLRRAIAAGAAISLTSWAVPWLYQVGVAASDAVLATWTKPDLNAWGNRLVGSLEKDAADVLGKLMVYGIVVGLLIMLMMLLGLQSYIRAVELTIALIVGPVCALSAAGTDDPVGQGSLGMWVREVSLLASVQVVQTALLVGVMHYALPSEAGVNKVILAIPLVYGGIKLPSLLRNYIYGLPGGASLGGTHTYMRAMGRVMMSKPW